MKLNFTFISFNEFLYFEIGMTQPLSDKNPLKKSKTTSLQWSMQSSTSCFIFTLTFVHTYVYISFVARIN